MLIIGAKGFAKEVLEVFHQLNKIDSIAFYDDVNKNIGDFLFDVFPILKNEEAVKIFFKTYGNSFTIGIGNPILRHQLYQKFTKLGGVFESSISPFAQVGFYGNSIANGCNIMTGTVITSDVSIGLGGLVNLNCTIGHDSVLNDFVELCPGVHISGNCKIGSFSFIGTNSTVIPNVTIGKNVIVGAGSVVTKDIPDNCLAVGIPAKVIKELEPIDN